MRPAAAPRCEDVRRAAAYAYEPGGVVSYPSNTTPGQLFPGPGAALHHRLYLLERPLLGLFKGRFGSGEEKTMRRRANRPTEIAGGGVGSAA